MHSFSKFLFETKIDLDHPTFIRWGGLSPVIQKGYDPNVKENFHSPPAKKGFYAFVYGLVEPYLLGNPSFDSSKEVWVRDKEGKVVDENHPLYAKYFDTGTYRSKQTTKGVQAITVMKPPRRFKYDGDIWHHLGDLLHGSEIIKKKDLWYLSSMESFVKALKKEMGRTKWEHDRRFRGMQVGKYDRDNLEVFIERI